MTIDLRLKKKDLKRLKRLVDRIISLKGALVLSLLFSTAAIAYAFFKDYIIIYGDAESHLNIAKRVVHSLTPGMAQLGGIWLPLPHLLMLPFVYFNFLWNTGLAGSIVSGVSYVVTGLYIYRITHLMTKNNPASFAAFLVFALNPNVLYMQTTPMSEMPLLMFMTLSAYYFFRYLDDRKNFNFLLAAAAFGFCSTLSRYDGWFLVGGEAAVLFLTSARNFFKDSEIRQQLMGKLILFSTVAFFGILLWMFWDWLILGDPFYFTNSQFSARTQQEEWFKRGELPAYRNAWLSFLYYFLTSMSNSGLLVFAVAVFGLYRFLKVRYPYKRLAWTFILMIPFLFNVFTLYMGQSVIFLPHITPADFEWTLFNVRYGLMVVPAVAFFVGFLFYRGSPNMRKVASVLFAVQMVLYLVGYSPVISLEDGKRGLSEAKRTGAEAWLRENYRNGLVLLDDYARTVSIIRSGIPMQNVIYIGNKPYWEESLTEPERHADWIVVQENDTVWENLYSSREAKEKLYRSYRKVYTSPNIIIFKRMDDIASK